MTGRPSTFSQDVASEICDRLVEGLSLAEICRADDMPPYRTVFRWIRDIESFRLDYMRAREDQGDTDADAISDIAHKVIAGVIDPAAGRVAIDAKKWTAGRRKPKVYGDKLDLNHSGGVTVTLESDADRL